jgi:hypothetical protein
VQFGGLFQKKAAKIRKKGEKSHFFGRKVAVRESNIEKYFFSSVSTQKVFQKKFEFETFLCRVRVVFRLFSRAKNEILQLHVAVKTTRKRSQNQNLKTYDFSSETRGGGGDFSVSPKTFIF